MRTLTAAQFMDNPDWASFITEMTDAPRMRHLPSHEDCARLNVDAAAEHLCAGGTLGRMAGYEERPGQIDMLKAIAHAFNNREHLMIEAGTGVGKSLAYLIPSILWAWTNDTPVVISTATRNLQSQLIDSDIPRAVSVLGDNDGDFRVALLKGRANYLCLRAVDEYFSSGYWTLPTDEQELLPDFIAWLKATEDGDLDRYEGLPRSLLTCPGEDCSGRRCPFYARCFVYKARKRAAGAHLVVANHALVLSEATSAGGGILPNFGRLVLDEAHNLEDIATDYLSSEFSMPALTRVLNRLMRRGRGRRAHASGLLASIDHQMRKGLLAGAPEAETIRNILAEAPTLVVRTVNATDEILDLAGRLLSVARPRDICRYRVADGVRMHSLNRLFAPYDKETWSEEALKRAQTGFEAELAALVNMLHALRDALDDAGDAARGITFADLSTQAGGIADALVAFSNEANFVLLGDKETHAYWIERMHPPKRPAYVRLVAAPLSVADALRKMLYEPKDSVVLASATLRVGNDFKYMTRRLGCGDRFKALTAASPFNYLRQALVLAADYMPDPSADPSRYAQALAPLLKDAFTATHGRALVLFTSYEMMQAVARETRTALEESGLQLLVQGEGLSREALTRHLREDGNTVVFGAQSFWEGVDVSGEALSCVVLARLPFAQVGEPIVEARGEKIDREGGSSFRDYSLPEAVIKFRQGFGRLIRSRSDRGIVIVTDPRLVTKSYGAIFRRSVPSTVHTVTDADELLRRIEEFFA